MTSLYPAVESFHIRPPDGPPIEVLPYEEFLREPLAHGMEIARVAIDTLKPGTQFDLPLRMDLAFLKVGGLTNYPVTQLLSGRPITCGT